MAAADRAGMTDLYLVPEGSSQIDFIEVEDNVIRGTATFIETRAFRQFLRFDGPEPNPVLGSFEIRCPRSKPSGDSESGAAVFHVLARDGDLALPMDRSVRGA